MEQRLPILVSTLKRNVFNHVGRSLFKGDRLTFGMHLVRGMNPDLFKDGEWEFFVGLIIADTTQAPMSVPEWVPPDRRPALQRLHAAMPSLVKLPTSVHAFTSIRVFMILSSFRSFSAAVLSALSSVCCCCVAVVALPFFVAASPSVAFTATVAFFFFFRFSICFKSAGVTTSVVKSYHGVRIDTLASTPCVPPNLPANLKSSPTR